ncbi:glycosyltransferase [Streptomyces sp. NPDC019937]|uniref:glycosyltransferase n=1 Tax=Streptomyces sp. NPDC019937 TaxID=3154787 RepID=UPI003407531F
MEKALHIRKQQREGIGAVRTAAGMRVRQHSRLQRGYLVKQGVDCAKIVEVTPPVNPDKNPGGPIPRQLCSFLESAGLVLFTAVARLDVFRDVDLLLQAGVRLMDSGVPVKLLIVGGGEFDDISRKELGGRVSVRYAESFMITERVAKSELYSLFLSLRRQAIFACTSRYETLGITPLEAALSGVVTVIPDSPFVEAARLPRETALQSNG